jgi:phosphoglycerol transferase
MMRPDRYFFRAAMAAFRRDWGWNLGQSGLWWLAFSTFSSALWIRSKFGVPSFSQFLFHVQLGFHGLLNAEYYVIKSFIVSCILLPGLAAFAVSSGAAMAALRNASGFDRLRKKLFFMAPVGCLFLACLFLLNQVSFFAYAETWSGPDYFLAHYKDPQQVLLAGKNPRNLVLIYVESLDASYDNAHVFGRNLLHSLDAPALGGLSFDRYSQVPGTGWTIAGIASTQCGVPLEPVTFYDRNVQGEKLKHFLPGAVCLGDVLNDFGYRSIFMGGAPLSFAGKGQFFKDHHYAELYGRDEWIALGEKTEDMNGWGLHDDDLFRHAKTKLDQLEASGGRFNLTLLTLDTHYQGTDILSKTCVQHGVQKFEDLVECTADQVADFVDYIRQKGYLDNVDVVILGDHLAMSNPVIAQLNQVPDRHIFNLFVSKDLPKKRREDIVHFDLFPTILDLIGIRVQKGALALGYSGFSSPALLPCAADRLSDMRSGLEHPSSTYLDLWKPREESAHRS